VGEVKEGIYVVVSQEVVEEALCLKGKEKADMTFQEFYEEEEKSETDKEAVRKEKTALLELLHEEGFTDQQVNYMKMKDVQQTLWSKIERGTESLQQRASKFMKSSVRVSKFWYALSKDEKRREELMKAIATDKALRKELFEYADTIGNFDTALHSLEDTLSQGLEELEKLRKKEKGKE
jgi:hypothetical protein